MRILYISYERGLEIADAFCYHCKKLVHKNPQGLWLHTYSGKVKCKDPEAGQMYKVASPRRPAHEVMYLEPDDIYSPIERDQKGDVVLSVDTVWATAQEAIIAFQPDIVIEREFNDGKAHYEHLYKWLKAYMPKVPRVWWAIDTHVGYDRHMEYAKNFTQVFCAISMFQGDFEKIVGKGNAYWLPLCFPRRRDSIHRNYHEIKYDVSFIGRWNKQWFPERTAMIEFMQDAYGERFWAETNYQTVESLVKRSRVSMNCSIGMDLNFRTFEVMAMGTELVTNDVPDLHKIKTLTERVAIFDGRYPNTIPHVLDPILANAPIATHDTLDNQEWIKENHCLVHRHNALLEMLETHKQKEF